MQSRMMGWNGHQNENGKRNGSIHRLPPISTRPSESEGFLLLYCGAVAGEAAAAAAPQAVAQVAEQPAEAVPESGAAGRVEQEIDGEVGVVEQLEIARTAMR